MPGPMTPEVHKLLASLGNPNLRLLSPAKMASTERKRAAIHESSAQGAHTTQERKWRTKLRNNAIRRAEAWAPRPQTLEEHAVEEFADVTI